MPISFRRARKLASFLTFFGALIVIAGAVAPRAPEKVVTNDNRRAAGMLSNGVLTVKLEARNGVWQPEGAQGRGLPVAAWAEEGRPLSVPGPLIRVSAGTDVRASLRNSLDKPLTVFGFGRTRGISDSLVIQPGEVRDVRFTVGAPGTYYYFARRGVDPVFFGARFAPDLELAGAIVVDVPGARPTPNDRVFVLSFWY